MILGVITFISIVFGKSFISVIFQIGINQDIYINGSQASLNITDINSLFNISALDGAIIILTIIITVAVGVGVSILGSGLSETAQKSVVVITAYIGLWTVLSFLSIPLILDIEVVGLIIYLALTVMYVIGVVQTLT